MSHGGGATVGIDIGTTSVKAVAVDRSGAVLERIRIPHPLVAPGPDRFEHDVERAWRRGPRRAVRALAHHRPAAVAVTTMVPSLAPLTARGRPLGPGLLYGDARGRPAGRSPGPPAASDEASELLRWLVEHHPDAGAYWPAAAVANHALSGRGVADIGTCFTMGTLLGAGGWSAGACAAVGADPATLPAIGGSGDVIGAVRGVDAVLASGSVDGYCEQLVSGADEPGDVLVLCGTTLIVWVVTDRPVEVPRLWSVPHSRPGRWLVGGASNGGGLFTGWLDRLLAGDPADAAVADPSDVPVWVPYVRGERTPHEDPARRASLHGLHLGHGPAHLRRAALEATGFVVRHHLDLVRAATGIDPARLVAGGGGTRVAGWMAALADATGLPVHVAADPEGAARGAAWLAGMAVGFDEGAGTAGASGWARTGRVVDPDPRWVGPATDRYRRFRLAVDQEGGDR